MATFRISGPAFDIELPHAGTQGWARILTARRAPQQKSRLAGSDIGTPQQNVKGGQGNQFVGGIWSVPAAAPGSGWAARPVFYLGE
jgi:hypothetical protein